MKTGVIVYIAGSKEMGDDFDVEQAIKKLNLEADSVEVVSPDAGHFDVMYAWWILIAKGMKHVVCMFAEIENHSKLRLTGRELRLYG